MLLIITDALGCQRRSQLLGGFPMNGKVCHFIKAPQHSNHLET